MAKRSVGALPGQGAPLLLSGSLSGSLALPTQTPGAANAQAAALSENVNLFQSLRVLQEGESLDGVTSANSESSSVPPSVLPHCKQHPQYCQNSHNVQKRLNPMSAVPNMAVYDAI